MGTPSSTQYFEAIHGGPGTPQDPNLFSASEIVAGSFDSLAVSTATSKAVSTINAAAPDSSSISTASSKATSAASVGSVADSKGVSGSTNTSVADSKALSVSGSTSIADSKAVSVASSVPILTVVANSQTVSTADSKAVSAGGGSSVADSKAVSVSANTSTADSKAASIATELASAPALTLSKLILPAGGITDGNYAASVTGALPASANDQYGNYFNMTSAGAGAGSQYASRFELGAGYTGPGSTFAMRGVDNAEGSGAGLPISNRAIEGVAHGTGAATGAVINIGVAGQARWASSINIGVWGLGIDTNGVDTRAAQQSTGVYGRAQSSSGAQIGGMFAIGTTDANFNLSAALVADNRVTGLSVFLAQVNGVTKFSVDGTGLAVAANGMEVSAGNAGIGAPPLANFALNFGGSPTSGSVSQYGAYVDFISGADATSNHWCFYGRVHTAAGPQTLTVGVGLYIDTPAKGAGSSISTSYGVYIASQSGVATPWAVYVAAADPSFFGGTVRVTGAFGCNGATVQTAFASGGAAPAGGAGAAAGGWDTAAHRDAAILLLNNIRSALVANGIMS